MKVRYTLPIQGILRILDQQPIIIGNFSFHFESNNNTGFVTALIIEIRNIPKEKWPTIIHAKQDPQAKIPTFPFAPNKNALQFRDIHKNITNLENILSIFGLWSINMAALKAEWIFEDGDEHTSIFAGGETLPKSLSDVFYPVDNNTLSLCIIASGKDNPNIYAVSNFRTGRMHFDNMRYIDSIRHLFFFLEYEFGNGKYKKKDLKNEFRAAAELIDAIKNVLRENEHYAHILARKIELYNNTPKEFAIIDFFIDLRGELQHANRHTFNKWNSSQEEEYEHVAAFLLDVVDTICAKRIYTEISSTPTSTNSNTS
ncbi:hypothetical protein [Nitratidesulfovibrio sp.]|uniref:hypothetical protein n=1 Tax=Nitratidesulfovibrio sp. TaxID=2802297 RepID=UPI00333FBC15